MASICQDCLEVKITQCEDNYEVLNLDANTDYFVVFTDTTTGKGYSKKITTDGSGKLTIPDTTLPTGWFNPFKQIKLEVYDASGDPVETDDGYTCLALCVENINGDLILNKIDVSWNI